MIRTFTLRIIYIVLLITALGSLESCGVDLDPPEPYLGSISMNRYLAIGDGYTAGFSNGGLYPKAQENAFPSLYSQQLQSVGITQEFRVPLLPGDGSGYSKLTAFLDRNCDQVEPFPETEWISSPTNWAVNVSAEGPYDNLGIPGLEIQPNGFLSGDQAYFDRLAANGNTDLVSLIYQQDQFDFFTLWLGLDEIMKGARDHARLQSDSLYSEEVIRTQYRAVLDNLLSRNNTKGVVANLPDLFNFPLFAHIPHTAIDPSNCFDIQRPLYIQTSDYEVREATPEDYIMIEALGDISLGSGPGFSEAYPIAEKWVLDVDEAARVREYLKTYNKVITELVQEVQIEYPNRVAFLNMNQFIESQIIAGHVADGIEVSGTYLTGGFFSLDGYSLTPRGNAIIANAFIETTNRYFSTGIPTLNISDFTGVEFP